ncbi:hypothetical protein GF337_19135 [candidate division KSB1 bacterium]|nr:hypothetical protein [candidate division KSB1 bacterium]
MNYTQAIDYLYQLSSLGWKLGLNKIRALLKEVDNPHQQYPIIHIAGTNGKGSTSAILESILRTAGYTTGLFTSPHLIHLGERITVNGIQISQKDLVSYVERLQPLIEKYKCTFFEAITAIAFIHFAERKVDVAVVEVGLGGRLDATNVVSPILSIITEIEHDHTKQLGRSRRKIAAEKGGIIKRGAVCLTGSQHKDVVETLAQICRERKTELMQVSNLVKIQNIIPGEKFTSFDLRLNGSIYPQLKLPLLGEHQIRNATLAIMATNLLSSEHFDIKIEDVYHGLFDVRWHGRLQILDNSPKVIVDVAHNPDGTASLVKSIQNTFVYDELFVILGIMKNKNYRAMVKNISAIASRIIAVKADTHRALDPRYLVREAEKHNIPAEAFTSVAAGLEHALGKSGKKTIILGTGSHYTVGELINCYKST